MKFDGPYFFEYGDLWYKSSFSKNHVCGPSENLAVAIDEEDSILHKHGPAELVKKWIDNARKTFIDTGFEELATSLVLIEFSINEEIINELNACISCSGRIKNFKNFLSSLENTEHKI